MPAVAETRVALVIGNSAYKHAPALANPRNDAEGVAASLKRLKFDVLLGVDLDEAGMRRLLRDFAGKVEGLGKDDVALVFYAGHGLQVNGGNYLVPVDAKLEKESDLAFQAVSLEFLSKLLEQTPHTNIVILDSCRDNPLARNLARTMGTRSVGIGRGLGQTQAGVGTLIVYATQPGNVALDGDTKNSPFTAALLKHIEAPGLEVRLVVSRVRQAVIATTKGKQVPWDSSSLVGEVYLAAKPASPGATPPAPETKPPASTPPAATDTPTPRGPAPDGEMLFWQSIKDSKSAADFKDYLARWPTGTFAELAKRRLAELEKAADVTPPAPAKPDTPAPAAPTVPRRVSTYETGTFICTDKGLPGSGGFVDTARECQARCMALPNCVVWRWGVLPGARPHCAFGAALCPTSKPHKDQSYVSGIIRTTPAVAPAQPARPQPGAAPAPAPQPGDPLVQELIRKARAGEREDGFCSRVNWPTPPDIDIARMLAPLGAAGGLVRYRLPRYCGVIRAGRAALHNGVSKRSITYWRCDVGGTCVQEQ